MRRRKERGEGMGKEMERRRRRVTHEEGGRGGKRGPTGKAASMEICGYDMKVFQQAL